MGDFLSNPALVTGAVLLILVAGSAFLILRENRVQKEKTLERLKKSYGKPGKQRLGAEKLSSIGAYARFRETKAGFAGQDGQTGQSARKALPADIPAHKTHPAGGSNQKTSPAGLSADRIAPPGCSLLDDITWNDLALDELFCRIGGTVSDPGDAVLYDWLRHPLLSKKELSKRARAIKAFEEQDSLRLAVQRALSGAGRLKKLSYFEAVAALRDAKPVGAAKYAVLGLLTLGSILLFFFQPLLALFSFLALAVVNLSVYLSMREKTGAYVTAFGCILRLLSCGQALSKTGLADFPEERARLSDLLGKLSAFRRGSVFVMAGAQINTGLGNAVLQYINMFFHLDLVSFDRMLLAARGEEDTVTELLGLLGGFDAACAAAGFRASLTTWTEGEIEDSEKGPRPASVSVEGLCHPLLENPIPNDLSTNGGNLLTGSNASGKSTFLKSLALAAILGQSLAAVPAKAYRAPFFRVLTSMALSDNLRGGESYFIVEIRSLKRILDAVEEGGAPVLGIVDEVLRGTNTIERIAASSEILRTLATPESLTFAATHDIELSYILEDCYKNLHFEETFDGKDVRFDYTLREGRATSRNAIRLLAAAGYGEEITQKAETLASDFERTGVWKRA